MNRLKELRKEKRLALKDVAIKTRINISTISNYENGYSFPKINNLKKLASFYEVSVSYILEVEDNFEKKGMFCVTETEYVYLKEIEQKYLKIKALIND